MHLAGALGIGMAELMATAEGLQAHGLRVHDVAMASEAVQPIRAMAPRSWFRAEDATPRRGGDAPTRAMTLRDLHDLLEQLSDEDLAHVLTLARRLTR